MTPYYQDGRVTVHAGDCLAVLPDLPDASVDAVVTDPPYGLEFMGKEWDRFDRHGPPSFQNLGPTLGGYGAQGTRGRSPLEDRPRWSTMGPQAMLAYQAWCQQWATECLRVLKPGGHLLAFGGTRTYHRLASGIEDAGFEIRDSIAWLYGSGFSKSWNFKTMYEGEWCECEGGKPLPLGHASNPDLHRLREAVSAPTVTRPTGSGADLLAEVQRREPGAGLETARPQGTGGLVAGDGSSSGREDARREQPGMDGRLLPRAGEGLPDDSPSGPPASTGERLRSRAPAGDGGPDWPSGDAARRGASPQRGPSGQPTGEPEAVPGPHGPLDDGALRGGAVCARCGGLDPVYKGFGTGIKPASEPIVVARKPLAGTVAANVLAHGTGALNIDATRVGTPDDLGRTRSTALGLMNDDGWHPSRQVSDSHPSGRWPPNVALDDSQAAELDAQSGVLVSGRLDRSRIAAPNAIYGAAPAVREGIYEPDSGGASRFFPTFRYEAKADTAERPRHVDTAHPTVKPLDLMRWLVRLVTPPGGLVLDPFLGSGTTAEACQIEGFRCIGIEREAEYLPLIVQRLTKRTDPVRHLTDKGADLGLFELFDQMEASG